MHRSIKPHPHPLCDAAGIVAVCLVDLCLQRGPHVPRFNANHWQARFYALPRFHQRNCWVGRAAPPVRQGGNARVQAGLGLSGRTALAGSLRVTPSEAADATVLPRTAHDAVAALGLLSAAHRARGTHGRARTRGPCRTGAAWRDCCGLSLSWLVLFARAVRPTEQQRIYVYAGDLGHRVANPSTFSKSTMCWGNRLEIRLADRVCATFARSRSTDYASLLRRAR
jgi:hypothetical protein